MANPVKVIVCGDSFCSAENGSRDHFSQILEDLYGYEVINLARGGIGTVGICFQMRKAVELKPDVIIYNTTSPNRIEIIQNENFILHHGLKNFAYPYQDDVSSNSPYVGGADAPVFSTVWQGIDHMITPEQAKAIQLYLRHLFHWSLKYETDRWMISYWRHQAEAAGIRALYLDSTHFGFIYEFVRQNPTLPRLFHTDRATQEQAAKKIHEILSNEKTEKTP